MSDTRHPRSTDHLPNPYRHHERFRSGAAWSVTGARCGALLAASAAGAAALGGTASAIDLGGFSGGTFADFTPSSLPTDFSTLGNLTSTPVDANLLGSINVTPTVNLASDLVVTGTTPPGTTFTAGPAAGTAPLDAAATVGTAPPPNDPGLTVAVAGSTPPPPSTTPITTAPDLVPGAGVNTVPEAQIATSGGADAVFDAARTTGLAPEVSNPTNTVSTPEGSTAPTNPEPFPEVGTAEELPVVGADVPEAVIAGVAETGEFPTGAAPGEFDSVAGAADPAAGVALTPANIGPDVALAQESEQVAEFVPDPGGAEQLTPTGEAIDADLGPEGQNVAGEFDGQNPPPPGLQPGDFVPGADNVAYAAAGIPLAGATFTQNEYKKAVANGETPDLPRIVGTKVAPQLPGSAAGDIVFSQVQEVKLSEDPLLDTAGKAVIGTAIPTLLNAGLEKLNPVVSDLAGTDIKVNSSISPLGYATINTAVPAFNMAGDALLEATGLDGNPVAETATNAVATGAGVYTGVSLGVKQSVPVAGYGTAIQVVAQELAKNGDPVASVVAEACDDFIDQLGCDLALPAQVPPTGGEGLVGTEGGGGGPSASLFSTEDPLVDVPDGGVGELPPGTVASSDAGPSLEVVEDGGALRAEVTVASSESDPREEDLSVVELGQGGVLPAPVNADGVAPGEGAGNTYGTVEAGSTPLVPNPDEQEVLERVEAFQQVGEFVEGVNGPAGQVLGEIVEGSAQTVGGALESTVEFVGDVVENPPPFVPPVPGNEGVFSTE